MLSISTIYKPSSQEIHNFKTQNKLSTLFNEKCEKFLTELNKEIEKFQTDYNLKQLNTSNFDSIPIRFYSSKDDYFELSPFYNTLFDFTGIKFTSSEQFYDFAKALKCNDKNTAFKILIQSKANYCFNYALILII